LNIIQPKKIDAQRGKGAKKSHPFLITKNENETDSASSKALTASSRFSRVRNILLEVKSLPRHAYIAACPGRSPTRESLRMESSMTVNVDEQNYRMEQSYNLALAIWSLVEQNAASLRAEGASDATVGVVQRDAVAGILAEVCYVTGGNEDELIGEFSERYSLIKFNPELSIRHHGEPEEPADDFPADYVFVLPLPVNPFGDRRRDPAT
jgi:hypothetical protein